MLAAITLCFMIAVPLFSLIILMFCSKHLTWPKWVKIITGIILIVILLLEIFVFPTIYSEIKITSEKDAVITTMEIEEIYESCEESTYLVKLTDSEELKSVTGSVFIGDSNYLVKLEYPNMTDNHIFWISSEKKLYNIVVTSPDVIKKIPEFK